MKTVFLYAGQGSQKPGMGRDFYQEYESYRKFADRMYEANQNSGFITSESYDLYDAEAADLKTLMEEGPAEKLARTEYTQVCMAVFAAGVTRLLAERGIRPAAACGLSLGEYGALYAAGAFSAEEYVRLLDFRGRAMAAAARGCRTAMTAVMGSVDGSRIQQICQEYTDGMVTAVNYNCPGQTVICGDPEALTAAEKKLKEEGGVRCIRLKVSGPFHTGYMKPAGDALAAYFEHSGLKIRPLQIPVAANATGSFYQPEEDVGEMLVKQVQSSVYLEQNLRQLIRAGYRDFIEIGPGKTMAGFLNRTAKAMGERVTVQSIDTAEDFRAVIQRKWGYR